MIGRCPIPINLVISDRIVGLSAAIAGVALHGVNKAVLHLFHDTHMVGHTVLRSGESTRVIIAIGNPPLLLPS